MANLRNFGLLTEVLDLLFQDGGNFCGADVHQRASFIANLIELSLVRSELSTMRLPTLTIRPPMMVGSIFTSRSISLPPVTDFRCTLERLKIIVVQFFGDGDLRRHLALVSRNEGAKRADHVPDCEQAPIGRDGLKEVGGQSLDVGFGKDGRQRLELLIGTKCRAADKTIKIGTLRYERIKLIEILFDGIDRLVVQSQLEKSSGVAASHSRDDRIFACHNDARCFTLFTGQTPSRKGGANHWNSRGNSDLQGRRRSPREPPEIEG